MNYILQVPRPMGFSRQEYCSGLPCPPLGDLPDPGIEPSSSTLQVNSLLSELPGKPKNTGLGSLSPLWGNLPTLESNQGLLYCRWILYQLSYPGSTHWVRDLPAPGIEPVSLRSPALANRFFTTEPPGTPPPFFFFSFATMRWQNWNWIPHVWGAWK